MKIVYYEMRKSFLRISTLVILIIFSILNFIQADGVCSIYYGKTYGQRKESYFSLYNTVCGKITEDKIAPFRERAKELENEVSDMVFSTEYHPDLYYTGYIFGDFNLYNVDIAPEITYAATYPNISNKISQNAAECYNFYKSVGNKYEAEKYALAYGMYQHREIPEYRATNWTNLFFNNEFSSLLCIIMLIFGLSNSFTNERESGMYQLINSSGKLRATTLAKIASTAVLCLLLSVYFTACDLAAADVLLGVEGLDMPLYSAKIFQNSPFSFNFVAAIMMWILQRFLALFAISLIMLLGSKIAPNTLISIVINFGITLVMIILTVLSKSIVNPINVLNASAYIYEFSVINIFGQPVLTETVVMIIMIIECLIFGGIITIMANKSRR